MNMKIKCPVHIGAGECGKEEILSKKNKHAIRNPDGTLVAHHECAEHAFHIRLVGGGYEPCGCRN
jgi:hypothetical protein